MSSHFCLLAVPGRVDMAAVAARVLAPVAGAVEGGMGTGDLPGRMCAEGWREDGSGAREATLEEEARSEQRNECNAAGSEKQPSSGECVSAPAPRT